MGNIIEDDDIEYEDEEYIDEYGNVKIRKAPKIKKAALKRMQQQEEDDKEGYYSHPPKRKVVREVEEKDEFGNIRKVLREVEEEGIKKAPKTRNIREKIIIGEHGNKKKV